ncbi:DUF4384 domain-containing protein [Hyphomicrobium sp. CS1GBMeth3]|uniref:DUF4384 domain-containing protein n=1 Tax=Hyphomicrobium sp. CS1GBMeth3 TaxID=1892845 RepID=UPI001558B8E3|nr:DUF4384 domain-containing protein [Hyphomicrobium sp. CS1GBMeth3]
MRGVKRLALLAALGSALTAPAHAEPAPLPERARDVLEAHCAECRNAHASGDRIDLEALAEDTRLIVPRRPDASRAYQHLVRDQAIAAGEAKAPTPAEVGTVRDWIESLPDPDLGCRGRTVIASAEPDALAKAWAATRPASESADARVLSLAPLWNACQMPERLAQAREAVSILLAALARRREPAPVDALRPQSAVLVVRLSDVALLPAEWERLTANAPRLAGGPAAIPADWLAAHVLARPKDTAGSVDPAFDVKFDAASQRAVERLARNWTRDVTLRRAAAERGVTQEALRTTLAAVGGEFLLPARRLMHGAIIRSAWDRLAPALDGEAPPGSSERGGDVSDAEIDVVLWTDKPAYRPRDLVTIHASVSKACHLTLIDVDREGKAVVLFPNELEPDNLVAPSVTVSVPGREAGYQFRFDRSGEEQIVAVCQRKSRRPAGIAYDYERERFAILGDWRTFLRTIPEREKKILERQERQTARRQRRGRSTPESGPPPVGAADPVSLEGRAAITVVIEPGGG